VQYDGGVLRNNRRIAGIQADQALADREEATERAENEINQVMIGIARARQRLSSLPDVEQARSALERVEGLMLAAPASEAPGLVAQVTNARQNLRSAVVSRNEAMTDFYSNYFRLQRAVGTEELRAF
jgi:outer membrane protein TolC